MAVGGPLAPSTAHDSPQTHLTPTGLRNWGHPLNHSRPPESMTPAPRPDVAPRRCHLGLRFLAFTPDPRSRPGRAEPCWALRCSPASARRLTVERYASANPKATWREGMPETTSADRPVARRCAKPAAPLRCELAPRARPRDAKQRSACGFANPANAHRRIRFHCTRKRRAAAAASRSSPARA